MNLLTAIAIPRALTLEDLIARTIADGPILRVLYGERAGEHPLRREGDGGRE